MAELHRVDIKSIEQDVDWDVGVRKNIRTWITFARDTLLLAPKATQDLFRLDEFIKLWESYWNWLRTWEKDYSPSPLVFAHNDTQYGNLLRLKSPPPPPRPVHHQASNLVIRYWSCLRHLFQIIVVDFEYASPNPAAFDIANHFHEWAADYHSDVPWKLHPAAYPSHQQRRNFYDAYLFSALGSLPSEEQLQMLDFQVRVWSPASHAMWAIWGIVQAREELETGEPADFDYLKYAEQRLIAFTNGVSPLLAG